MFLDSNEGKALTCLVQQASSQAKVLRAMSIEHRTRPGGTIAVLRSHVEQTLDRGVPAAACKKAAGTKLGRIACRASVRKKIQGLPRRWHVHRAYCYQVPPGQEAAWDGKKTFRLSSTLPEANGVWVERIKTANEARTIADLLDRYALEVVPTKAIATQSHNRSALRPIRAIFGRWGSTISSRDTRTNTSTARKARPARGGKRNCCLTR
jgi:hypothetical protein